MRRFIASPFTRARARTRASARVATLALALLSLALPAQAQAPAAAPGAPPPDEGVLGEFVITGSNVGQAPLPKIAVLPSLSPDLEDVIVRGVVRRDFELTGMYDLIPDSKAPQGLYGFDDPIDVDALVAIVHASIRAAGFHQPAPAVVQRDDVPMGIEYGRSG